MLLLGALGLSLVVGVLRGGRIAPLAAQRWRGGLLPFLAVGVQVAAFWVDESATMGSRAFAAMMHADSYLLLLAFIWLNRQTPWAWLVGLGLVANAAVILLNGGFMPSAPGVLLPGTPGVEAAERGIVNNIALMGPQTRLGFLADRFRIPDWIGLRRAFSIGDFMLAVGAFALVQRLMRPAATYRGDMT